MKRLIPLLGVLLSLSAGGHAQADSAFVESRPTVLGVSFDFGFLLRHSRSLREIDDSYPYAIHLDWSKQLLTSNAWDFCNCFPRAGLSLAYWNWDNSAVLGRGIVPMGYVEPYFWTDKRTNLFVRMGLGGAWLTNPFDPLTNPQNRSYSTRLSFSILVGVGLNHRISKSTNLHVTAKYGHISNGGIQVPNAGLNYPSVSLGLNKSLVPIDFPNLAKNGKRDPPEDKTRWSLTYFSGWSNASVGDKSKFYVFGIAGNYSRWFGGRSALVLGTEWIFDYSRRERIRLDGFRAPFQQGALLVGHEFWLGRVTFTQQLGVYYYNRYRNTDAVYQRYALNLYFTERLFGGFSLKAHRHVAEFFDFRLGYRF